MKLFTASDFLAARTGAFPKAIPLPDGNWKAVAIHPSSEVDLVDIGAIARLGVGGLVPISGSNQPGVMPVRRPCADQNDGITSNGSPRDGNTRAPGGKLVLQLYEACDALENPGPRNPIARAVVFNDGLLTATADGAPLCFRLPFQGRQMVRFSCFRGDSTRDLNLVVVGVNYGLWEHPQLMTSDFVTVATTQTWWNGGGAAPTVTPLATSFGAGTAARTFYYGGQGDNVEAFDELAVFAFGAFGGGGTSAVSVSGEVWGERSK
jgi:hypothetical protein